MKKELENLVLRQTGGIKELKMKCKILKELIERLYDGVGKEVMEEYLSGIIGKMDALITESEILFDVISKEKR